MIRTRKGAPPKGGRQGENQGGGNRSLPPPRRAKIKPTGRPDTSRPVGSVVGSPGYNGAPAAPQET